MRSVRRACVALHVCGDPSADPRTDSYAVHRKSKKKLYSLHEPDVQCISKGKAHKRYEFGQKVAVATTSRGTWIVASHLCEGNPHDGHTPAATLSAIEHITGVAVTDAYVDKGYRAHGYVGEAEVHIAGQRNGQRNGRRNGRQKSNMTRAERKRRRRRSALAHTVTLPPKIGHLTSDHRMGRCFLARLAGDAINAVPAATGSNLRKLLGLLRRKAGRFALARREMPNQILAPCSDGLKCQATITRSPLRRLFFPVSVPNSLSDLA